MEKRKRFKQIPIALFAGLIVGLGSLILTVQLASATATYQTEDEPPTEEHYTAAECQECHLDITNHWESSPHANAFSDPVFQERWLGMGEPGECLACHTTNYMQSTGEYEAEGISCQGCHGQVTTAHPPEPVPILADTEYCGTCHTTTLGEWRLTGHSTADIGCTDCHDPHSQDSLFTVADDLCLNCHEESMGEYLEGIHTQKEIGCVDCHALVIPPEVAPDDGIVPTGHAFTISPATCVACHTDALHSGFSLPGYENGASAVSMAGFHDTDADVGEAGEEEAALAESTVEEGLSTEQQLQALEAAVASQNVTLLFQGGIVGLVLGGTTAWFVANNVRSRKEDDDAE